MICPEPIRIMLGCLAFGAGWFLLPILKRPLVYDLAQFGLWHENYSLLTPVSWWIQLVGAIGTLIACLAIIRGYDRYYREAERAPARSDARHQDLRTAVDSFSSTPRELIRLFRQYVGVDAESLVTVNQGARHWPVSYRRLAWLLLSLIWLLLLGGLLILPLIPEQWPRSMLVTSAALPGVAIPDVTTWVASIGLAIGIAALISGASRIGSVILCVSRSCSVVPS